MPNITDIQAQFDQEIGQAKTATDLEKLRITYLGRNGTINALFQTILQLPQPQKSIQGKQLNLLKQQLEIALSHKATQLEPIPTPKIQEPFFTKPKIGHLHPITQTENLLNNLFKNIGFSIYDGPEIETDEFCFTRLNVPTDHPARDMQDSIYIQEPNILLRTQTSSIEARALATEKPPFRIAFPGRVFRNEKVNKSNHFIFHQYQAVVVDKHVTMKDLFGTINYMFQTLYGPDVVTRFRCKYYPEVEPGVGPDMLCFSCHGVGCPVCKGVGWIEMGGAGMIHPKVLKMANIDPEQWQGFAFGMGLDRWTMAKFNLTDIRSLLGGSLYYRQII